MRIGSPLALRVAGAEHAVDLVEVGVGQRGFVERFVLQEKRVVGLHVLPPAHVADEAGIVQNDALPPECRGGFARRVGEENLVDLLRLGIAHDGAAGGGGIKSGLAVFVAFGRDDVLALDHRFQPLPRRRRVADARAQRDRIGIAQRGLVHAFEARAHVGGNRALPDRLPECVGGPQRAAGGEEQGE
jgi:hypothetical protein